MADELESPPDSTKVVSSPLTPISVTVIGTKSEYIPKDGTIATTASGESPNLRVTTVGPFKAVAIRFGNNFFFGLGGACGAVWGSGLIPFTDVVDGFKKAVLLTLILVVPVLFKDIATVFSGLEKTHPLSTGSI